MTPTENNIYEDKYLITYTNNSNPNLILSEIIIAEDIDDALRELYSRYNSQIEWRTISKIRS